LLLGKSRGSPEGQDRHSNGELHFSGAHSGCSNRATVAIRWPNVI
jgi:hypothetical protein